MQSSREADDVAEAEEEIQGDGSQELSQRQGLGGDQEPLLPQILVQSDGFHLQVCGHDHAHVEQLVTMPCSTHTQ